jgi:transcriptional regulator with XRE-family HTH domain
MTNRMDRDLAAAFGPWLREQIDERGLSVGEAARLLRTTPATVRPWMRGQGLPSYTQLTHIVSLFGALPPGLEAGVSQVDETTHRQKRVSFRETRGIHTRREMWLAGFARLREYVDREGSAAVPYAYVDPDGFRLGRWVSERRRDYKRGILGDDKANLLAGLRGWTWNSQDALWQRYYDEAEALSRANPDAPDIYYISRPQLQRWMADQRRAHHEGRLRWYRRRQMERLRGWDWGRSRRGQADR